MGWFFEKTQPVYVFQPVDFLEVFTMDDADGDAKKPIVRRADLVPQYVYPTPPLPPPPVDPVSLFVG